MIENKLYCRNNAFEQMRGVPLFILMTPQEFNDHLSEAPPNYGGLDRLRNDIKERVYYNPAPRIVITIPVLTVIHESLRTKHKDFVDHYTAFLHDDNIFVMFTDSFQWYFDEIAVIA